MRSIRSTCLAAVLVGVLAGNASARGNEAAATNVAAPATPAYLAAALANPARQADRATDARRKAGELLAFSGVKPGDKVLELIPGSGYFSRLFSLVVGKRGHVYAVWPAPYAQESVTAVQKLTDASHMPVWANISVAIQPAAELTAPEALDLVFTSQNYHDYPDAFMGHIDPMVFNRAVFKALKPGGTFIVIDHVAQAGSGLRDTDTLHRIDPAIVKAQVQAAGFVFEAESEVLRNPADPHDIKVFDPSIRGRTDQFVFRFRKPRG